MPINDGVVTLDSVVASDSVAVEASAPANVPASASVSAPESHESTVQSEAELPAPESHESTVQSEAESPKQTEPTDTIVAPAEVVAPVGIVASADEPAPVSFTRADSVSGASAQKSKKAPVASADTAIIREPLPTDTTSTDTTSTDTTSTDTTSTDTTSVLPVAPIPATASTDTTTIAEAATADTAIANATAKADTATAVRVPFAPKKDVVALRTNLLYDAVLVPNIGIEVWLGKQFTLGADWFGTWLSSDKKHIFWQGYGGYLTLRYYFGKQAAERRFTGHHVGLYGSALTYDVEFGGKGYQAAKFGFGGGIEYGYSLQVHRCLAIDFNIGVGYQGGEYKTYQPTVDGTGHYVWLATYNRNWWGPTKAEISLKWLIAPVDKKKGGEQ